MPYIDRDTRNLIDIMLECALDDWSDLELTSGDLNYIVTNIVTAFIQQNGTLTYTRINAAIGVLECAKLELYRRLAAPYEDKKINDHGDIERYQP